MIFNIGKLTNKKATEFLDYINELGGWNIYQTKKYMEIESGKIYGYNSGVYGLNYNIRVQEAKKRVFICGDYNGKKYIKKLSGEQVQQIWDNSELLDQWEAQEQKTE